MAYSESAASVLRVAGPTRLVVRIEGTGAVVELQLARQLTPLELARARRVTPLAPCPAVVTPGRYSEGVFWQSHAEVAWPKPETGHKRVAYALSEENSARRAGRGGEAWAHRPRA